MRHVLVIEALRSIIKYQRIIMFENCCHNVRNEASESQYYYFVFTLSNCKIEKPSNEQEGSGQRYGARIFGGINEQPLPSKKMAKRKTNRLPLYCMIPPPYSANITHLLHCAI